MRASDTNLPPRDPQAPANHRDIRSFVVTLNGKAIYYRTNTQDRNIFHDILIREDYACVESLADPKIIIDCGSYVGYSALYFLTRFPNSHVIAIEAEQQNFDLCRLNLDLYRERVTILHAAVWPESVPLVTRDGKEWLGSDLEWANTVELPEKGQKSNVDGIDLESLISRFNLTEVDLLKFGVPARIFSGNPAWLRKVHNLVVRLIDEEAEDEFFNALGSYGYYLQRAQAGVVFCTKLTSDIRKGKPDKHDATTGNLIANGDFGDIRVPSGYVAGGEWIAGSHDPARFWRTVVCDPQFFIGVAVRTGAQSTGQNALYVHTNAGQNVAPVSAPYAAIEHAEAIDVTPGEEFLLRALLRTEGSPSPPLGLTRAAYIYLRLHYDDGTWNDLRTEPQHEVSDRYIEIGGTVRVPEPPGKRRIRSATLWLYVWLENRTDSKIPADDLWNVYFDNVSCHRV